MKGLLLAAAAISIGLITTAPAQAGRPACNATQGTPVLVTPSDFDKSQFATEQGFHGTANVRIDLTNDGIVIGARIVTSSGSSFLDREALQVARTMKFVPDRDSCPAIAGSYSVLVSFQ